jgi:50S ribosomal subunit-associated GTPase HflX
MPPKPRRTTPQLDNKSVLIAALVSAKIPDPDHLVADATTAVQSRGGTVVGTLVQRRGVSRGGVRSMESPLSSALVFGTGKAQELAELRTATQADVVVVCRVLTLAQRERLEALVGCPVLDGTALHAG